MPKKVNNVTVHVYRTHWELTLVTFYRVACLISVSPGLTGEYVDGRDLLDYWHTSLTAVTSRLQC